MRIPKTPPPVSELLAELGQPRLSQLIEEHQGKTAPAYLHWDKLRHLPPPNGLNHREWWLLTKIARADTLQPIALADPAGKLFQFSIPPSVQEKLHRIDMGGGGMISLPELVVNPQMRDRYIISSLIEEAITSSQLEGALTTREVAKDMIRSGRPPCDVSEQMILNNYQTMQHVVDVQDIPCTPEMIFDLHKRVTYKTLEDANAAGRFRRADEKVCVADDYGIIYHEPPPAYQLENRLLQMCAFANGETPAGFVHPVARAIILHFWLAYDHPFVDGNGRTARALFYWSMLRNKYWMAEFISISSILRKAPTKYARSFLYTETDDNDMTYFLMSQVEVIDHAINELHSYVKRKTEDVRTARLHLRALQAFNHRQVALINHALKHPGHQYTFKGHQQSHQIAYQTARTDLLELAMKGVMDQQKGQKLQTFISPNDLHDRLLNLG